MRETIDDKEISTILKDVLKLQTNLTAVKVNKEETEGQYSSLRYKVNICQMVAMARYHNKATTQNASGMICALGASCIGLIRTPERLLSGEAFINRYVKEKESSKKFASNVYKLGDNGKQFDSITIGPLGEVKDPSVVVLYLNPAQILPLIHANAFDTGEKTYANTVAEGALCEAIGYSIGENKARIGFPCAGDRRFGGTQKDELIFAIPYADMPRIFHNLLELKNLGVSVYPIAPNVMWTPSMPEAYTIKEEDLN